MNYSEESATMGNQNEGNEDTMSICLNTHSSDIINNKGIIFLSCIEDGEKTDPEKIQEWFSEEFIKMHKVYAIKEEEAFLLKIYTRDREVTNKILRKKGGRKPMLMGQEVHGEIILACGRCGYHSNEGSNVRRHLKKSVCARDRGYSKTELDGLNRIERQKFIRRVASAKFRAKKKLEAMSALTNGKNADEAQLSPDRGRLNPRVRLKPRRKCQSAKALMLGPLVREEAVKRISFDVFTVVDNIRVAWKPPVCHKGGEEPCQIVFKGARMKRRCLDLPLPIILTYRKLDCKVHHCNFTLFHSHARKAFKEDSTARMTLNVRTYGDTVMTQEFYHHFVSLLSVMKMKSSQCARHLTRVWETILIERLQTSTVPEDSRKMITLSKQTVKSIWSSIEEEAGRKSPLLLNKVKKKRPPHPQPLSICPPPQPSTSEFSFSNSVPVVSQEAVPLPDSVPQQHPQVPHSHHLQLHQTNIHHPPVQAQPTPQQPHEFQGPLQQDGCLKRYTHVIHKPPPPPIPGPAHPLPHSHSMLQGPSHPHHWVGVPVGPTHPGQYSGGTAYPAHPPHEEYYSVQASFVTQYTPSPVVGAPS